MVLSASIDKDEVHLELISELDETEAVEANRGKESDEVICQ